MAETTADGKLKPTMGDRQLSEAEALDASITAADIARAMARWGRRVPGFFERIKAAAQPPQPPRGESGNVGNSEVSDANG